MNNNDDVFLKQMKGVNPIKKNNRIKKEDPKTTYKSDKKNITKRKKIITPNVNTLKFFTSNKKETELLIEMIFQLGIKGCLKFKNLIKNMRKGNKHLVCLDMMNSLWYKQTPYRVKTMVKTFLYNEQ